MRTSSFSCMRFLWAGSLSAIILSQAAAQTLLPQIVVTKQQANQLFGGKAAKMIILENEAEPAGGPTDENPPNDGSTGPLYLIDFSADSLKRVFICDSARDAGSFMGDPMISPDGSRVAYNILGSMYVCYLLPNGPGKTKVGSGYEQRWWVNPQTGDEYLIYLEQSQCCIDINQGNIWILQITKGGTTAIGSPHILIAGHSLNGGRSPDGMYMCTSRPTTALVKLTPALAVANAGYQEVYQNEAGCNASMGQDPAHPTWFTFLTWQHDPVTLVKGSYLDTMELPDPAGGYKMHQWTEWSTHADYLSSSLAKQTDYYSALTHEVFVYRFSTKTWTQITHGGGPTHLWVAGAAVSSRTARETAPPRKGIRLLPHGQLAIDGLAGPATIAAYDARGVEVMESRLLPGQTAAALPHRVPPGRYMVRLTSATESIGRSVIVR